MKIKSADGVEGVLLNPCTSGSTWVFRVYLGNGDFADYDLCHSDLCVTINDKDAYFYSEEGYARLDHSPATLGQTE